MSVSNRIIRNTGYLYLRTLVSLMLSVFTTRFILQGLGESDFGLYNVIGGSIAMLGFLSASLSASTQRFINYAQGKNDENHIRNIFANSVIIHHILAASSVILFSLGGFILFNGILNIPAHQTADAIAVYGCMLVSTVFSITIVPYDAEITAHEDLKILSLIGILDVILKLVIAICVLYWPGERLIFYAILMAAESFVIRSLTKLYCIHNYTECRQINLKQLFDRNVLKELSSFAGWNMLNTATSMVALFGINVVINHYFGTVCNASMGIATQLAGVIMGVSMNLNKAITPVIMKSEGQANRDATLHYSIMGCKFSYLVFLLICTPILLNLPFILSKWLTEVPAYTVSFCLIMICGNLLDQTTIILYQSIMAQGDIKLYSTFRSISNIAPIIITIIMFQVGDFPPYWALLNWLIWKAIIGGIINITMSKMKIGLRLQTYFHFLAKMLIVSGICITLSYCATLAINPSDNTFYHILAIFISYLICGCSIYLFGLTRNERGHFNNILSTLYHRVVTHKNIGFV